MKHIKFPVYFTTSMLFVYTILAPLDVSWQIMMVPFIVGPFLVVWMVYRVLRDGIPSEHTFESRFYDDYAYERNHPSGLGEKNMEQN